MQRLQTVTQRVKSLTPDELSQDWPTVRRRLLWAGGLRDLQDVPPGQGYTGHAFNDHNHCDLTTMLDSVQHESNADGRVAQISRRNLLGPGIRIASDPELGPGGSWSTCTNGCHLDPPQDVAHVQFQARIAFKLVWSPVDDYKSFVLVDDEGCLLANGTPQPPLPDFGMRRLNFDLVRGSKYARAAEALSLNGQ